MEYGLRRYEAAQRLFWLLVFMMCLGLAYHMKGLEAFQRTYPVPSMSTMKSLSFWSELQGIQVQPPVHDPGKVSGQGTKDLQRGIIAAPGIMADINIYLILVAVIFLGIRTLWLLVQFFGKYLAQVLLHTHVKKATGRSAVLPAEGYPKGSERLFPADRLAQQVNRFPFPLVFHAFKRLKLMLSSPLATPSAEELTEKERRTAEADWQILWQSWQPFNWIVWTLPVLALIQSVALFYIELLPILSGKREISDVSAPLLSGLVPLIQAVAIAASFKVASAVLKRIDDLYLSNLDALLYDQLLSRLPFQSGDTLILLQAMQKHFHEIQTALKRLERSVASTASSPSTSTPDSKNKEGTTG